MSNFYYNDSVLANYEFERLKPDYDITSANKSIKERIKALEAVIESYECADLLDKNQSDHLEAAKEEIHELRRELNYL